MSIGWPSTALGDVCDIDSGGTPSRSVAAYWGGAIPWAKISDIERAGREVVATEETISEAGLQAIRGRIFDPGTLLIAQYGSVGKWAFAGLRLATNQAILGIRTKPTASVLPAFLGHYLTSMRQRFDADARGVTQKNLSAGYFRSLKLRLPPFQEQRRIAAVLDKAEAIRTRRRAALADADKFIASAFAHLVGELAPGHEQWPLRTIEQLAQDRPGSMRTGPFGSDLRHSEFTDEGITVLGIDNAVKNRFAWGERRFITAEKYQKLQRYRVLPGDVIVTIMGTTGRSAVAPDNIPVAISTKHLATISLDREQADPHFISWAIHSAPALRRQIAAANKGAIMDGLNLTIIRGLKIRLPPLSVQQRFSELVRRHYALVEQAGDPVLNGDELYASLAARAFQGEL